MPLETIHPVRRCFIAIQHWTMETQGKDDSKLSWVSEWHRVADGHQTRFTTVTSSSWSLSTPCTIATTVARSSGLWNSLWLSTLASTNSTVRQCSPARSVGRSDPCGVRMDIYAHMQMFGCREPHESNQFVRRLAANQKHEYFTHSLLIRFTLWPSPALCGQVAGFQRVV